MAGVRISSGTEQVAAHLRQELSRGRWRGTMPGKNQLAGELGLNHKIVEAALGLLERNGVLVGQGPRRRRLIAASGGTMPRPLRIAILLYESTDRHEPVIVELQHALAEAGHVPIVPSKSLTGLRMDVARIGRLVETTAADAWVVVAGSREVLEWFCGLPTPAFALFGRRGGLPIAGMGPDLLPRMLTVVGRLIELGHRRIVKICRRERRYPIPGQLERAILDELKANGIPTGDFNLPDWEETKEGLQELLEALFEVTPPTALIFDEAPLLAAALQFFGRRGIRVPEDVSLVCARADPTFDWCVPAISHVTWDGEVPIRRIVRWAAHVGGGKRDLRQTVVPAKWVAGGTIGPVPGTPPPLGRRAGARVPDPKIPARPTRLGSPGPSGFPSGSSSHPGV